MDMALLRDWSEELAQTTVDVYRSVNFQIKDLWGRLNAYLDTNWRGIAIQPVKVGPVRIGHNYEHKYGYVLGPSGLELRYNKPRRIKGQLYYDFSEVRYQDIRQRRTREHLPAFGRGTDQGDNAAHGGVRP
jgi:hypothetical protein